MEDHSQGFVVDWESTLDFVLLAAPEEAPGRKLRP